jgi:hypothetical protein
MVVAYTGKTFAPPVVVNPSYVLFLRGLLHNAHGWMVAANGHKDAFNNPIGRMIAKDVARQDLDRYFKAIDDVLPKESA